MCSWGGRLHLRRYETAALEIETRKHLATDADVRQPVPTARRFRRMSVHRACAHFLVPTLVVELCTYRTSSALLRSTRAHSCFASRPCHTLPRPTTSTQQPQNENCRQLSNSHNEDISCAVRNLDVACYVHTYLLCYSLITST